MKNKTNCINCGAPIIPSEHKCDYCGTFFSKAPEKQKALPEKKHRKAYIFLLIALGALGGATIAVLIYANIKRQRERAKLESILSQTA